MELSLTKRSWTYTCVALASKSSNKENTVVMAFDRKIRNSSTVLGLQSEEKFNHNTSIIVTNCHLIVDECVILVG